MTVSVRLITEHEIEDWTRAQAFGFNHVPAEVDVAYRRKHLDLSRALGAFDAGGELIGTANSFATPMTLPGGGSVVTSALTAVAVTPTHRRRGALTAMMRSHLDAAAAAGEPAAILIAAEAPIYGRYGYGGATRHGTVEIDTPRLRLLDPPADTGPRLRFVERDEFRTAAPVVFDRLRVGQPGEIGRDDLYWDGLLGVIPRSWNEDAGKRFHVVAETERDGRPVGYLAYRVEDAWLGRLPNGKATVDLFAASSHEAYVAMWDHLLRLDWVTRIEAGDRPIDEPLHLLVNDARHVRLTNVSDFLWTRLLDVAACLAARTYAVSDRLVLEVVDRFRPASGGRFAVDGGPDGATCQPTDEPSDLVVGTADLAAAWLGGAPLWLPAQAGRVDERTPGARRRFDTMFTTQPPPFCSTWF
jgi:predicted acetyltransferase